MDAADQLAAISAALAMQPGPERDDALVAALADDGELLADEPYAEWAARPREHLESVRQQARLALARDRRRRPPAGPGLAVLALGWHALEAWLAVFEHDPASEEAAGALMHAYHAQGHRELAVRVYERCAAALAELALSTSPSLDELHAAITQPAPSAARAPGGDPAPGSALAPGAAPAAMPPAATAGARARSCAPSRCCSPRSPRRPGWAGGWTPKRSAT